MMHSRGLRRNGPCGELMYSVFSIKDNSLLIKKSWSQHFESLQPGVTVRLTLGKISDAAIFSISSGSLIAKKNESPTVEIAVITENVKILVFIGLKK